MLELNLAKAKELLEAAVEEYGENYVYPYNACRYVLPGGESLKLRDGIDRVTLEKSTIGCGVGVAMLKAGFTLDQLTDKEGGSNTLLRELAYAGLIRYTHAAKLLLANFQGQQDDGVPWGEAYEKAAAWTAEGKDYHGEPAWEYDDETWLGN